MSAPGFLDIVTSQAGNIDKQGCREREHLGYIFLGLFMVAVLTLKSKILIKATNPIHINYSWKRNFLFRVKSSPLNAYTYC